MSFVNDIIKGVGTALIGTASQVASAKMEYSQTKEGQKRQFEYNKLLNADSYGYQTKLNTTAYNRQKALNSQAYSYSKGLADYSSKLTTAQNQWNALNLPALNRQGYESAGINPVLAVNSQSPAQMIGASGVGAGSAPVGSSPSSSVGGAVGAKMEILQGMTDAYRTFMLDTQDNLATLALKKAQTDNTNAKTITEGYNQSLIEAEQALKMSQKILTDKESSWKDRLYANQIETNTLNALANMTGSQALQSQATTARLGLSIQKYNSETERLNYNLNKDKSYKDLQSNRYWNSNTNLGHFRHAVRESIRTMFGR